MGTIPEQTYHIVVVFDNDPDNILSYSIQAKYLQDAITHVLGELDNCDSVPTSLLINGRSL